MPNLDRIDSFASELTAIRRDIHAHPEIGFEEHRTSGIVADKLQQWGIEVHRGLAKTGVSDGLKERLAHAPTGPCTARGIAFHVGRVILLKDKTVTVPVARLKTQWLLFMHTTDVDPLPGSAPPSSGCFPGSVLG